MKERVNKPRAFISYSRKDSVFIERIESDLRNCQIEPWLDRKDIRDGKPWLESIFEEGLPTCDVVIAYFTRHSLTSNMVAREVDATQIRLLEDKGISFLPYVDRSETRDGLRLDLKTLQCRVWNTENYNEVLPTVVAEVGRSYLERVVSIVTVQEKSRRLEAELELQTLRSSLNDSPFSPQEESEFKHIYGKLKGLREAVALLHQEARVPHEKRIPLGKCLFNVSFLEALRIKIDSGKQYFGRSFLGELEAKIQPSDFPIALPNEPVHLEELQFVTDLKPMLTIYGLLSEVRSEQSTFLLGRGQKFYTTDWAFSNKLYRFVSWVDYHNRFGHETLYEFVEFSPTSPKREANYSETESSD